MGGDVVHQRRVQAVIGLQAQLPETGAHAGHLIGVNPALDHGRHKRRETGLGRAVLDEAFRVDERQPKKGWPSFSTGPCM